MVFGGDIKFTIAGGQRYIPVDVEASMEARSTVYVLKRHTTTGCLIICAGM